MSNYHSEHGLRRVSPEPLTLEEMELQKSLSGEDNGDSQLNKPYFLQPQFPILRKIISYLTSVQKYTGYLFTTFAGIHLTSVVVAPGLGLSLGKSQDLFEMARTIYLQVPGFETTFITGATIAHIISGISIRGLRYYIRHKRRIQLEEPSSLLGPSAATAASAVPTDGPVFVKDGRRDDVGLGGLASLFGLGYKRAWISRLTPELTPLTFSGYLLIPVGLLHYCLFRRAPLQVDGDSSLISLQYISHVIGGNGNSQYWNVFQAASLIGLVWLGSYHMVSGLWKIRKRFSKRDKRLGYILVNGFTLLSVISLLRIRRLGLDSGFMGKQYGKYLAQAMPAAFRG